MCVYLIIIRVNLLRSLKNSGGVEIASFILTEISHRFVPWIFLSSGGFVVLCLPGDDILQLILACSEKNTKKNEEGYLSGLLHGKK